MTVGFFRIAASFQLLVNALAATPINPGCKNPTCSSPPCRIGKKVVGCSTANGTEVYAHGFMTKGDLLRGKTRMVPAGARIYGPFEAGMGPQQKSILEALGCSDPKVAYDEGGGTDVGAAEASIAKKCGISLPRLEGTSVQSSKWIGIVGSCGGHTGAFHELMTKEYNPYLSFHFHRSMSCLYKETGAHSTAVGEVAQWQMYGKWEDYANKKLPYLDACGGHFGVTPDSNAATVYHYHVQGRPPYTVGCHGPTADNKLVGVAACRSLYTECSNPPSAITTPTGTRSYVRFCPCYDVTGSNWGTPKELLAFNTSDISYIDGSTTDQTKANSNPFGTDFTKCEKNCGSGKPEPLPYATPVSGASTNARLCAIVGIAAITIISIGSDTLTRG